MGSVEPVMERPGQELAAHWASDTTEVCPEMERMGRFPGSPFFRVWGGISAFVGGEKGAEPQDSA
jgi:hypothetical protein